MPSLLVFLYTAALSVTPATAESNGTGLPAGVREMIEAAIASGDGKAVATMLRFARETHASASGELDQIEARWQQLRAEAKQRRQEAERAKLADAGLLENWAGQIGFGASRSTGKSSFLGAYGSLALNLEGLRWRQRLAARAEVQEGRTVTDNQQLTAAWQPNYKFDDQLYAFGLASSRVIRRRATTHAT